MFNKILRQNNRELKQRILELEKTCNDLDDTLDYKNDIIKDLQRRIIENEYREQLWEKERKELNNVIANLMSDKNKLNTKNIRTARKIEKIEADNHDKATSI